MATVFGGIYIVFAEPLDVFFCAQDTGNDYLVQWNTFYLEAVEETPTYVLQQVCGSRHKVWDASVEFVNHEIRIA